MAENDCQGEDLIQRLRDIARRRAATNEPGGSPPAIMAEWQAADEIVALRQDNERLQAIFDGDYKEAYLKGAGPGPDGTFQFDIQASIVPLIAEHLAQTLKGLGGENYVGLEFQHAELGPLVLTIQRKLGETPGQKAARFEAEILSLSQERDRLREALAPFAEVAERHSDDDPDEWPCDGVTLEDARRARAALKKEPPCQET